MNFSSASQLRPDDNKIKGFPYVDKVLMVASDSGKYLREEPRESPSTMRHILFPSRSPPPAIKKHSEENIKIPSLAPVIDRFAAVKITPENYCAAVMGSSPKRSSRQTLHRRNKHVFVASHSPTKSKSNSPLKTRTVRKHHRRHNAALNAMDFKSLLKME